MCHLCIAGLDKALFNIASNYVQNQTQQRRPGGGGAAAAAGATGAGSVGGAVSGNQRANWWWNKKGKMPTDPSQWKYCELCKMTCPGPQVCLLEENLMS